MYLLRNDLHVHVSVIFNHPPLLVVPDSTHYSYDETPLVMASRNGHTQVVDFLKSRLPQSEYIVTVYILVYYIFNYITEGYPLLEFLRVYGILIHLLYMCLGVPYTCTLTKTAT